jgi:hypothetical protein
MGDLPAGIFLRWIEPQPGQKPLGIVISSPVTEDDQTIYVLMADRQGNTDLEVFVARPEATGVDASTLVLESMEVVEDRDRELMALLRQVGPNWWHIGAHLDGVHDDSMDPECLLCREPEQARIGVGGPVDAVSSTRPATTSQIWRRSPTASSAPSTASTTSKRSSRPARPMSS